jgi:hypothetical protein
MINDCQQCEDFDLKTKELVGQFLSQDEVYFITLLLAGSITAQKKNAAQPTRSKKEKMQAYATIRFLEQLIGKMMVSMNPQYADKMQKECVAAKIQLKIQHGPCPHKESKTDEGIQAQS